MLSKRAIRTVVDFSNILIKYSPFQFKETIGRIIFIKQAHLSRWAHFIKPALKIINEDVVKINQTTLSDYYARTLDEQFRTLPEPPYMFEIGDFVALKSLATKRGVEEKGRPGFKRSLGKQSYYFSS